MYLQLTHGTEVIYSFTDTTNNLLVVEVEDVSSPNKVTINCILLSEFNGSTRCQVPYGTDSTYMNLPYSAKSTETGTAVLVWY